MKNTIDLFPTLESKKINEVESNDSQLNKKNNLKTGALSNLSTKHKIDIFSSETISQYIVEKLISYTFYELKKNEHEGKIGQFCYNFFENFNLLEHQTENIFYDRDDFYQDDSGNDLDQLNKLPFEFIYEGENSWNISRPPKPAKVDVYASSSVKIYKNSNINSIPEDNSYASRSPRKHLNKKSTKKYIERLKKEKKSTRKVQKKFSIKMDKSDAHIEPSRRNTQSNYSSRNLIAITSRSKSKTAVRDIMKNDTEFSRIKPDLIEYLSASEDNEDEDIRDLRIRKMKELQYKEVEIKRQHEKERILKQQRLEEMQKIREFDGKKITLDHEGKVIYIKDLNIDKLAVDFSSPKNIIKDKTSISKINKMNSKKKLSSLSSIVNVNRGNRSMKMPLRDKITLINTKS